jgi:hypothetical protein
LWDNGLLPDPTADLPLPCRCLSVEWVVDPDDGPLFCCHGYGDGSGRRTQLKTTRRCGWSVVAAEVGDDGIIRRHSEAYGPLAASHQNVHSAELFAFLFYLRHSTSVNDHFVFYSDCAYVVDGFLNGRSHNTHGWAVDADLWCAVFDKVDDVGAECVYVFKFKAHRHVRSAIDDHDRMQIVANNRADALAKMGVTMHEDCIERRLACYSDAKKYKEVVKYSTRCLSWAIDRALYQEIQGQQLEFVSECARKFVPGSLDHKHFFTALTPEAKKMRCVKCFSPATGYNRFGSCHGDAWCKGHRIARLGHDIILCIRCGAYSVGRVYQLMSFCAGRPWSTASVRAKANMTDGKHPTTGAAVGSIVCLARFFKCSLPEVVEPGDEQVVE